MLYVNSQCYCFQFLMPGLWKDFTYSIYLLFASMQEITESSEWEECKLHFEDSWYDLYVPA